MIEIYTDGSETKKVQ